jgi:hemolysin activation/secretion protein
VDGLDESGDAPVEVRGAQAGAEQTALTIAAQPVAEGGDGAVLPACNPDTVIVVETIVVSCSTILTEATVTEVLAPFLGRPLSAQDQQEAADALTRYYLEAGYITSRALPQDSPTPTEQLHLRVIEGGIDTIAIDGLDRLHEDYLRSRIGLATQPPINTARLEDQLRLLRQSPLLDNIEASLLPGNTPGNSTLRVRVDEANPFNAFVGLDNYSPPVLGTTQGTLALAHQNLTGRGDRLAGSLVRTTTGGRTTATLGYAIPLNPMEGTLQINATFEDTRIPLMPGLDVSGKSQTYGVSFRQPLIRTPREELALSLGFDYQNGQTFIGDQPLGLDPNGISRTAVVRFGQDYVSRDLQGAWALRSRFSLGTGLFGATVNPDPLPDGRFFSWLGQAQRVQRLSDDHLLIISADVQLTPDPLLSSEKFVLGGAQTVRGYRQNLVGGDNGFRVSVEDRIALQRDEAGLPTLQLAPFVDMGSVWNVGGSPAPVQGFLMGLGLGLIWEPTPQLNLRVDYGLPLVNSPSRGNSWQEQGLYFQLGYRL